MILTDRNCKGMDNIMKAPEFKSIEWDNNNLQILTSLIFGIMFMNPSAVVSLFVTEDNQLDWNSQVSGKVRIA